MGGRVASLDVFMASTAAQELRSEISSLASSAKMELCFYALLENSRSDWICDAGIASTRWASEASRGTS